MHPTTILALPILLGSTLISALPTSGFITVASTTSTSTSTTANTLEAAILAAAPGTSSCSSASFPDECRTASSAAPSISSSFSKYGISSSHEQAALVALMLYESGEFKYNRNHWPGTPGQGTRNMQMPNFNALYATELFGAQKVGQAGGPAGVLALVAGDAESFASAAWFLVRNCAAAVRQGLQAGTQAGWEAYLTGCIGTSVNADRNRYWTAMLQQLGG